MCIIRNYFRTFVCCNQLFVYHNQRFGYFNIKVCHCNKLCIHLCIILIKSYYCIVLNCIVLYMLTRHKLCIVLKKQLVNTTRTEQEHAESTTTLHNEAANMLFLHIYYSCYSSSFTEIFTEINGIKNKLHHHL